MYMPAGVMLFVSTNSDVVRPQYHANTKYVRTNYGSRLLWTWDVILGKNGFLKPGFAGRSDFPNRGLSTRGVEVAYGLESISFIQAPWAADHDYRPSPCSLSLNPNSNLWSITKSSSGQWLLCYSVEINYSFASMCYDHQVVYRGRWGAVE